MKNIIQPPPIGAPKLTAIEHSLTDLEVKCGKPGYRFGHDPDNLDRLCFFDEWREGTPNPRGVFDDPGVTIDIDACNLHLDEIIARTKDMLRYPTQGRTPEGYHRRYISKALAQAIARCHAKSNQSVLF